MTTREKLKSFAFKHENLLAAYRATLGKLKTKYYFDAQKRALAKNGMHIIGTVISALEEAGAECFIDLGTLLGIIRDGHPIEHDRDMDFGIYLTQTFTKKDLDRVMLSIGMKPYRCFRFRGEVVEATYKKGLLHIDFFNHCETQEGSVAHCVLRNASKQYPGDQYYDVYKVVYRHITGLRRITVDGVSLNVPVNAEEYLASAYTEDWRTPNPKWNVFNSPAIIGLEDEYGIVEYPLR